MKVSLTKSLYKINEKIKKKVNTQLLNQNEPEVRIKLNTLI
jgi:hypothetical protein